MELKHLHTLLAIRDRKSFTAAARALGITQAAVSQHVAGMEDTLGVKLFDRRGRKISLTPCGTKLCVYAERITELVAEATADVQGHQLAVRGVLRIASSTVPAATVVPQILSEFRRKFPHVRPELKVSESQSAVSAVQQQQADVGFVGVRASAKGIKRHCVAKDELVLVVASDDPLSQRSSISLKQLTKLPLIVREPNSGSYRCLVQALQQQGLTIDDMQVAMQANSNDAIIAAVRSGSGVTFVSSVMVAEEVKSGELHIVKVRAIRPTRKLYMITMSDCDKGEPLRSFTEVVQAFIP